METNQDPSQLDWDEVAAETLTPKYYESYELWRNNAQKKYERSCAAAEQVFKHTTKTALDVYDNQCRGAYTVCLDTLRKRKDPEADTFRGLCSPGQPEWDALLECEKQAEAAYTVSTQKQRDVLRESIQRAVNTFVAESAMQVAHLTNLQKQEV